jgi:hypothetical protein
MVGVEIANPPTNFKICLSNFSDANYIDLPFSQLALTN